MNGLTGADLEALRVWCCLKGRAMAGRPEVADDALMRAWSEGYRNAMLTVSAEIEMRRAGSGSQGLAAIGIPL